MVLVLSDAPSNTELEREGSGSPVIDGDGNDLTEDSQVSPDADISLEVSAERSLEVQLEPTITC